MIKNITLIQASDIKKMTVEENVAINEIIMKRKYGSKFQRPIYKLEQK